MSVRVKYKLECLGRVGKTYYFDSLLEATLKASQLMKGKGEINWIPGDGEMNNIYSKRKLILEGFIGTKLFKILEL